MVTAAVAASPTLPVAFAAMVPLGFVNITINTYGRTFIQLRSDRPMLGRVMALHALVFAGTTPIGGYLAGWVSEGFGAKAGIAMGAVTALALGLAYLPTIRRREIDVQSVPTRVPVATSALED